MMNNNNQVDLREYFSSLRELIFSSDNISFFLQQTSLIPEFSLNNPIDITGQSCLHIAVQVGNEAFVEYLCSEVDVNVADCLGRTPLHLAVTKDNLTIIKMLIASKADVNYRSISGETPLIKAIKFNKVENIHILLRYGADSKLPVNEYDAKDYALRESNKNIIDFIDYYRGIKDKLVMVVHSYIQSKKEVNSTTSLSKLTPKTIQKLTGMIIP